MDVILKQNIRREVRRDWYRWGKRCQDILLSAAALLVAWPVLFLIGILIVLDSPGASPIFIQERVGKDGRLFRLYKFRTMIPHAEKAQQELLRYNEMNGPVFKIRADPRITRFGRFLRRSGLDELPQLWNVLRGEMSLVGPRPGLPREAEQYTAYQRQRLYIRPGLTCYWQIQPERNSIPFETWMDMDIQYLQEESFRTDWKILFATVKAVLRMDGQ